MMYFDHGYKKRDLSPLYLHHLYFRIYVLKYIVEYKTALDFQCTIYHAFYGEVKVCVVSSELNL